MIVPRGFADPQEWERRAPGLNRQPSGRACPYIFLTRLWCAQVRFCGCCCHGAAKNGIHACFERLHRLQAILNGRPFRFRHRTFVFRHALHGV